MKTVINDFVFTLKPETLSKFKKPATESTAGRGIKIKVFGRILYWLGVMFPASQGFTRQSLIFFNLKAFHLSVFFRGSVYFYNSPPLRRFCLLFAGVDKYAVPFVRWRVVAEVHDAVEVDFVDAPVRVGL